MDYDKEKRQEPRLANDSVMNMYRMDFQDDSFYAQMKDYSSGGLSMRTKEELVIGQLVYLEMIGHDKGVKGPEKHKGYSGSVKWKKSVPDSDNGGFYQYGIEYFEPVQYH